MFEWHYISPDVEHDLASRLEGGRWKSDATLVKHNTQRTVYHAATDIGNVYIKYDHPTHPRTKVKRLWTSKAEREFTAALMLLEAGVPTARPLAWARSGTESLLVTEEIVGEPLAEVWPRVRDAEEETFPFLVGLAGFIRTLLATHVVHPDMHAGNVLVTRKSAKPDFFLVDVYGVRTAPRLGRRERNRLLGWLVFLDNDFCDDTLLDFLIRAGIGRDPPSARRVWDDIVGDRVRRLRRKWPGRRRRLLQDSSVCAQHEGREGVWRVIRPFAVDRAKRAVEQHREQLEAGRNVLKVDRKRQLTRVVVDGESLVVKEFRRAGPRGRWAPDRRSWLNTYRLGMHGFRVAGCRAWCRTRAGAAYLVLQDAGESSLPEVLKQTGDSACRRRLLIQAASVAASLHRQRIFHRDLKLSNFVVTGNAGAQVRLTLVDSDDVHFYCVTGAKRRARNLDQMLETLPENRASRDGPHLLSAYERAAGLNQAAMASVLEHIRMALPD